MPPGGKSEPSLDLIRFMVEQIQSANKPVIDELRGLRTDVGHINGRLEEGDRRLEEYSEFIDYARPLLERCKTGKHMSEDTTTIITRRPRRVHWALMILAGGALTWVGEHGIQTLINALADKPAAVTKP